ncbi:MAG: hypothetical protein ACLPQY_30650, partial [Streptosporangiaceae bacterium]
MFGAIAGLLTAAVALGVGQLVSGLSARQGSPAVAVGQAAIDLAPPPVKDFAISAFGSNDKTALVIGILVLLAVFAAVIGVAAMRRLSYGYAGLVIFTVIGMAAALTRPDATFAYAVPTIVGAAVGAFTLNRLIHAAVAATGPPRYPARVARRPGAAPTDRYAGFDALPSSPGPGSGPASGPASTMPITPPARPGSAGPGGSPEAPAGPPPEATAGPSPEATAGPSAEAPASPSPEAPAGPSPEPATSGAGPHGSPERPDAGPVPGRRAAPDTWTYHPPADRSRRHFLLVSGAAAGGAAVAAFAGRELNARQSVTQARATLRLPAAAEPAPPLPAGTDLHIPGLSSFITPNSTFYRVDTAIVLPEVDP